MRRDGFPGQAVHPRAGDESYPEFFMQRCTQCKRCTEECPFGAINEDEKANPLPNPTRCRRCGVCMGACPERIISFRNYSVPMIGNMIKSIHVPDEYEEKPRLLVLACENDAYPALDLAGIRRLTYNPWVRFIQVRCLGSMNLVWIADALSKGIDGILLLGCRHGEDYQCHFIKGSELATIRMTKIRKRSTGGVGIRPGPGRTGVPCRSRSSPGNPGQLCQPRAGTGAKPIQGLLRSMTDGTENVSLEMRDYIVEMGAETITGACSADCARTFAHGRLFPGRDQPALQHSPYAAVGTDGHGRL